MEETKKNAVSRAWGLFCETYAEMMGNSHPGEISFAFTRGWGAEKANIMNYLRQKQAKNARVIQITELINFLNNE